MRYLKTFFIIILFGWISFFPQPIQDRYKIYTIIFLGIFLFILILQKKYQAHLFSFSDLPLWIFLIFLSAGNVSAINKEVALNTCFYLASFLFLLFYIGKGLFLVEKDREIVSLVICICAGVVAFIGLLELYFRTNIIYERYITNCYYERYIGSNHRLMSTLFNPAVLGSYLIGSLPFSFYLCRNKLLYLRWIGISSVLISIIVIVLTFSRGVFLGFIALALFYLWQIKKKKIVTVALLCLALFVIFCSYRNDINLNRFGAKRLLYGSYDSVISEYRWDRIKMTIKILKEYPFFGIGFNHFRLRFDEYCDDRNKGKEVYEFKILDNMYLTFLAETGLVGIIGFLFFIFYLFKQGFRYINRLKNNKKQILVIVLSALVGLLINMGGYELFYWANPYMLFCLICGFIQGLTYDS